jgi:hypothetical protein
VSLPRLGIPELGEIVGPLEAGVYVLECEEDLTANEFARLRAALGEVAPPDVRFLVVGPGRRLREDEPTAPHEAPEV